MKETVTLPVQSVESSEPAKQPKPEQRPDNGTSRIDRSFARVPVASGAEGDERAEAVFRLVRDIAGKLGVRTGQIQVRVGHDAQIVVGSRNADGVATNGVVYLRSETFDPASRNGQQLLAHEAAHVAQSLLPGAVLEPPDQTHAPAEIEAGAFAERYASTRTGQPVKVPLQPSAVAANTDFDGLVATVKESRGAEIARIIDLLSYGVFDWAVTDGDVFDVLHILAMYSVPVARAIARNIGEKYRGRLFSNLNAPHYAAHRSEILAVCWAVESESEFASEKYQILNLLELNDLQPLEALAVAYVVNLSPKVKEAASADAKRAARIADAQEFAKSEKGQAAETQALEDAKKEEKAEQEALKKKDASLGDLVRRIKAKLDEIFVSDKEALELLDAIANECLPFKDPANKFRALANELTPKYLDELIGQIPAKGLYQTERRRKTYVYLVATRPPFKNEQIAENLMSSPWWQFWDTVTSEEAFLAYLLVKSMPERARNAFLKARGGEKWTQVIDELPRNIRESATFNFYEGGAGQKDRQAILTELLDDKIWTAAQKDKLDATIRMARAAGESQFAFEQSKAHRADKVPELKLIVDKYQLYVEGKRETYVEKPLEGHAWYQEGIFAKFSHAWNFLALLFGLRNVQLLGHKLAADVDLNDLYDYGAVPMPFMGGDQYSTFVKSARFHPTTRKERKEARKKGEIPLNVLRGEKRDNGEIVVDAPSLLLDQFDLAGATTVTAAPVSCKGLHLSVKYTPTDNKPISLEAGFDELILTDCAIVSGDSIYAVNTLTLTKVRLRLSNEAFDQTEKQDGLGAMFSAILNPKHAMGVRLAFEKMALQGVATSGGFFVQSIEIDGFVVQAGGNAEAYVLALRGSATRLKRRIAEETQAAKDDPPHAAAHEAAKAKLEKQLEKTEAEIKKGQPHGSVVDIKSIRVSGVPGLADEPISLSDIHGQGTSVAAVVPLFADPTSIRNMIRGSEAAPTLRGVVPGESEFTIDIGRIATSAPLRLVGSIPTAEKAKKEFEDFETNNKTSRFKEGYQAVDQALKQRADDAKEYEALANRGVQNLTEAEQTRFRKLRKTLTDFEERRATIIESLTMEGVTLNISGDGNPELIAESLSAKGIKTFTPDGRENLHIGEITGQGVSVSATFTGGLANAKEWRKNLEKAGVKAQQLTLKDIRHAGTDAVIEELTFEGDNEAKGLEADFERGAPAKGGAAIGIKSRKVTAKGISIPAHAALLRAELERIESIPENDRLPEEKKRREVILDMLKDLDQIQGAKKKAEDVAAATKSAKERTAAQKQIAQSDQDLKNWQDRLVVNKLTIEYLDISISNLGDVFKEDYSFDKDAAEVAITGRGKEGHWFEQAELEGVRNRTAKGDQVVADRIVAGPVGGKLKKTKTGGYALEGFTVGSLAVRGVSYVSGDMKVQSIGESKLVGISIDAIVEFPKGQTDLTLTNVAIERIVADNLKYEDADKVVTVISGELLGLNVTNMHVVLPEDPKAKKVVEGDVSLDAVKSLALSGVAGGYQVEGTLNAPKPKGEEAHALTVNFAKSGEITVGLQGLSATADVKQLGTGNKVHIQWKNLGGKVVKNGDNYTITGLTVGNLTLSQMNWQAGGKTITVNDKVTLTGISLDAEAALEPKKKGPATKPAKDAAADKEEKAEEPEKKLSKLLIKKLKVDEINAKDVEVYIPAVEEDKAKGIEFSPRKYFHLEQATIRGLTVTGFDVLNMRGKVEVTKDVSVTNLRTVVGQLARDDLKVATASFKVYGKDAEEPGKGGRELSATLMGKDGTIIRLGRTDSFTLADIWTYQKKDGKKGKETINTDVKSVNLAGITTGDLIIKDDYISINNIEVAGPISISGVSWKVTGATTQNLGMELAVLPELLTIHEIRADFKKVPTGKIVAGKEETRSELNKFTISGVSIPKVSANKLTYHGPLESKKGTKTIDLFFPTAAIEGITINSLSKSFTDNLLSLDAKLKSASLPGFAATLTETVGGTTKSKKFGADITSGEIRADAIFKTTNVGTPDEKTELDSGYFELDSIGLRNITGKFSETGKKDQTVDQATRFGKNLPGGAGAELKNIRHDKSGTTVGSAKVSGVRYLDPNLGLTIDIQELDVPSTTTIPTKGPVTIPDATITNAFFRIDDILALKSAGGGGGGGSTKPIDTEQFYSILDHVNGHFKSDVYVPIYLFDMPVMGQRYLRQDVFNIDMPIKDGKFNYKDVWSRATWVRNDVIASLQMDTDAVKFEGENVVPDWSQSYLTLEVFARNQIEWTPSDDAERKEMMNDQVRLKRIIRPDDKDTPEEKEEKKKKREKEKAQGIPDTIEPSQIELRNVDANLGIKGYIPLDLGDYGRIALGTKGGDAVTDLSLKSQTTSKLLWSLKQMAVTVEELKFGDTKVKGDKPGGAEIVISDVVDGSLEFTGGKIMSPKALEGTIGKASVKNLAIDLGEKK